VLYSKYSRHPNLTSMNIFSNRIVVTSYLSFEVG